MIVNVPSQKFVIILRYSSRKAGLFYVNTDTNNNCLPVFYLNWFSNVLMNDSDTLYE